MAECQDVADLLYNLLRSKSTTNRSNGIWALQAASSLMQGSHEADISGEDYVISVNVDSSWSAFF